MNEKPWTRNCILQNVFNAFKNSESKTVNSVLNCKFIRIIQILRYDWLHYTLESI